MSPNPEDDDPSLASFLFYVVYMNIDKDRWELMYYETPTGEYTFITDDLEEAKCHQASYEGSTGNDSKIIEIINDEFIKFNLESEERINSCFEFLHGLEIEVNGRIFYKLSDFNGYKNR